MIAANSAASPLPALRCALDTTQIQRGLINRVTYTVENRSSDQVDALQLHVSLAGRAYTSTSFSLEPGEIAHPFVLVGGAQDLPDSVTLATTLRSAPNSGERIDIMQTSELYVSDGMLLARLLTDEFTRGQTGAVRFTLENPGAEAVELLVGPTAELQYRLLDSDGNTLSTARYTQDSLHPFRVQLANGSTVIRIPAGSVFESDVTTITVPFAAPDDLMVELSIANVYTDSQTVTMHGLTTTTDVTLHDTAYYGEVVAVFPLRSDGDEDITISGRALDRATGQPFPNAPLTLVITTRGFERTFTVMTGNDGSFLYLFTPYSGESGQYTVCAVHPDLSIRPVQEQFVITHVTVRPAGFQIETSKNYSQELSVHVSPGTGTLLRNLALSYDPAALPQGIHLTPGPSPKERGDSLPFGEGRGGVVSLPFTFYGDNSAAEASEFSLEVVGEECLDAPCYCKTAVRCARPGMPPPPGAR